MLTKESLKKLELRTEAIRGKSVYHNAGWYSSQGAKIGWGDLDKTDLERIRGKLEEGEVFVILREPDSFWEFVAHNPGIGGFACTVKPEEQNPGLDYLIEKCAGIVTRDGFYEINQYGDNPLTRTRLAEIIREGT